MFRKTTQINNAFVWDEESFKGVFGKKTEQAAAEAAPTMVPGEKKEAVNPPPP